MKLQTDPHSATSGLSSRDAEISRTEYGRNSLSVTPRKSFLRHFLENLKDPVIKILLCALLINLIFVFWGGDVLETVGIGISVLLATLISTLSERGSETAFRRLSHICAQSSVRVWRDGILQSLPIEELVVGDVVLLGAGEQIPADGRLLQGCVRVDQSAMTGESREIEKHPQSFFEAKPSCASALLRGCPILWGECRMQICAVGDQTFLGGISQEIQQQTRESPLKLRLRALAKQISRIGYFAAILVALAHLFHSFYMDSGGNMDLILLKLRDLPYLGSTLLHAFMLGLTVIVVAVPEGLPMMIAVVLSSNIRRMVRDQVLVRKPVGIEAAGSMNLLFTDKTGTLTEGKMSVGKLLTADGKEFSSVPSFCRQASALAPLYFSSCLQNTSASLSQGKVLGGNATERALLESVSSLPLPSFSHVLSYLPFDSTRKYSAVTLKKKFPQTLYKGAPERLLPYVKYCYTPSGDCVPFALYESTLRKRLAEWTGAGDRVILLAVSDAKRADAPLPALRLICAVSLRDRLRAEASHSVRTLREAGCGVIMITGDNRDTARSIAARCGILGGTRTLVLDSTELAVMTDAQIKDILPRMAVLARALPTDKSRLVRLAQEEQMVVGMTGDGINDAPALKRADIGFAMGDGSQVAKDASDIIILDNNLSSIVRAVLYGRTIFKSIRKFITLQLTMNLAAVGVCMIAPFLGIHAPVTVVQMLWINLIMDTLGGLAFAGEAPDPSCMRETPKKRDEPILNGYILHQILLLGGYALSLSLAFLKLPAFTSHFRATKGNLCLLTAFFALFIFTSIMLCFQCRTDRLRPFAGIGKNKPFLLIMSAVCAVQILFVYLGGSVLRTMPLLPTELLYTMFLSLTVFPAELIRKLLWRITGHKRGF